MSDTLKISVLCLGIVLAIASVAAASAAAAAAAVAEGTGPDAKPPTPRFSPVPPLAKPSADKKVIKIGVLGDSISKNRNAMGGKGWPLYLGKYLGKGYDVRTFSANGTDCLRVPSISIWSKSELPKLMAFEPDVVLIMLSANSARKGVQHHVKRYAGDYGYTIQYVRKCKSRPIVYSCLTIPCYRDNYGIQADILKGKFEPEVIKAAKANKAPIIDCYNPLIAEKHITTDGVHLSIKGMQFTAQVIYKALTGQAPDETLVAELAKDWQAEEAKAKAAAHRALHAKHALHAQVMDVLNEREKDFPKVAKLTVDVVRDLKGDGPDRKGNTADDTWGFWFELAHAPGKFARLDLPTETLSPSVRKRGIRKKVTGPIGDRLPNKDHTEGWIYHSDWDGRFEGAWGDKKANCVILYPYVEKNAHMAVAVSYLVAKGGMYTVTGKVTDLEVHPQYQVHDGASWRVEVAPWDGSEGKKIAGAGPFGDGGKLRTEKGWPGADRPESIDVKTEPFKVAKGQAIRFVVDPNKWWGSDMTKVEITIERVSDK